MQQRCIDRSKAQPKRKSLPKRLRQRWKKAETGVLLCPFKVQVSMPFRAVEAIWMADKNRHNSPLPTAAMKEIVPITAVDGKISSEIRATEAGCQSQKRSKQQLGCITIAELQVSPILILHH